MKNQKFDLLTFELVRHSLDMLAEEMAILVMRSAHSGIVREILDYSTAICDGDGRIIAQGLTLPLHLGSIPAAMAAVLDEYGDNMDQGDVIILNDPHQGGMHLPDIFMFVPIFYNGKREGFSIVVAHQADIGGRVPGGGAADSTEIYQEGLRLPPLKLTEAGRPNEAVWKILRSNVRLPDVVEGDVRAQLAGCYVGEQGFLKLLDKYGSDGMKLYTDELLDYSERLMRKEIASWPDGEYEFADGEDHDGIRAISVPIKVKVTIAGDSVTVDFAGSSPQVAGAINATESFTQSSTLIAVRSLIQADVPNNDGCFRPITIQVPRGTVLNPNPPAACAARGVIGYRVVDTVFGALAQALPDKVPASGDGGLYGIRIGGYAASGKAFQVNDIVCGTWGARPWKDGVEGSANIAANIANRPIEIIEAEDPVRVRRYGFADDTAGAGKYRGGLAMYRELEFCEQEAVLQIRTHRHLTEPYGLNGGMPGLKSHTILVDGDNETLLASKITTRVRQGNVIRLTTASGGGFGNPFERDPLLVLEDALDGKVSPESARRLYGVELLPDLSGVDWTETGRLRVGKE